MSIRNIMYTYVYITCTCIHLIYSSLSSHACLPVHASMPHTDMCCHTPVHTWCIHSLHTYQSCVFHLINLQPLVPSTVTLLEWSSLLIGQRLLVWCAVTVKGLARSGTKDGFEQSVEKILRDEFQWRKWIGMELERWMGELLLRKRERSLEV